MKNNFNYILNGISHEININSSIKISSDPLDEKILLSNKFIIKIISDFFEYLNIDYCLINKTLLGKKIFNGVNIFEEYTEFLIQKNNIKKIFKEEEYLNNNNIYIENIDNKYLIINTNFYENIDISCYIYLFNKENNTIYFYDNKNNIFRLDFYDIYPIKKDLFEEFNTCIPNKINNVLKNCNINLNFINFYSDKIITKKFLDNNKNISKIIIYIIFLINF